MNYLPFLPIVLIYSLLLGCYPIPVVPVTPIPTIIEVTAPPNYGHEQAIFAYVAATLTESPSPTPSPTPDNPTPKGKCLVCNGKGKIDFDHDGKYDADCTDCEGTGIIKEEPKAKDEEMDRAKANVTLKNLKKMMEKVDNLQEHQIRQAVTELSPKKDIKFGRIVEECPEDEKPEKPSYRYYLNFNEVKYLWDDSRLQFVSETNPSDSITLANYTETSLVDGTIIEMDVDGKILELELKEVKKE